MLPATRRMSLRPFECIDSEEKLSVIKSIQFDREVMKLLNQKFLRNSMTFSNRHASLHINDKIFHNIKYYIFPFDLQDDHNAFEGHDDIYLRFLMINICNNVDVDGTFYFKIAPYERYGCRVRCWTPPTLTLHIPLLRDDIELHTHNEFMWYLNRVKDFMVEYYELNGPTLNVEHLQDQCTYETDGVLPSRRMIELFYFYHTKKTNNNDRMRSGCECDSDFDCCLCRCNDLCSPMSNEYRLDLTDMAEGKTCQVLATI